MGDVSQAVMVMVVNHCDDGYLIFCGGYRNLDDEENKFLLVHKLIRLGSK